LLLSSVACLLVQMRMHSLIGIDLHITRNSYLACVLATFTLIAYGLAKQAFDLLFRKNGMNYFALSLFALWVVPLFVLMMCGITEAAPKTIEAVAGISPFSGIAITATVGQDGISNVGRNIAFIVTGGVTIISVILYTFAVRRAQERAISVQQPVSKVPAQV
ncbi:MAG TPA: hypothetical protein VHV83_01745, partial [Armatimonadota bacterium]|nr:hypothetical protein [Armatimonadota bacterium]